MTMDAAAEEYTTSYRRGASVVSRLSPAGPVMTICECHVHHSTFLYKVAWLEGNERHEGEYTHGDLRPAGSVAEKACG